MYNNIEFEINNVEDSFKNMYLLLATYVGFYY